MINYEMHYVDGEGNLKSHGFEADDDEAAYDYAYTFSDKSVHKIEKEIIAPHTISGSYWVNCCDNKL